MRLVLRLRDGGFGLEALAKALDPSGVPKGFGKGVAGELVDGLLGSNDLTREAEVLVRREEGDTLEASEDDCERGVGLERPSSSKRRRTLNDVSVEK